MGIHDTSQEWDTGLGASEETQAAKEAAKLFPKEERKCRATGAHLFQGQRAFEGGGHGCGTRQDTEPAQESRRTAGAGVQKAAQAGFRSDSLNPF